MCFQGDSDSESKKLQVLLGSVGIVGVSSLSRMYLESYSQQVAQKLARRSFLNNNGKTRFCHIVPSPSPLAGNNTPLQQFFVPLVPTVTSQGCRLRKGNQVRIGFGSCFIKDSLLSSFFAFPSNVIYFKPLKH